MRLESKIAISSGALICTMLLSAFSATLRLKEADQLTQMYAVRSTVVRQMFLVRLNLTRTVMALEAEMALGTHAASVAHYRELRQAHWTKALDAWRQMEVGAKQLNLGKDGPSLEIMPPKVAELKGLEDKAEELSALRTPEAMAEADDLLRDEILPLAETTFAATSNFGENQLATANEELARLRKVQRLSVMTLWIATVLGALLGTMLAAAGAEHYAGNWRAGGEGELDCGGQADGT